MQQEIIITLRTNVIWIATLTTGITSSRITKARLHRITTLLGVEDAVALIKRCRGRLVAFEPITP
jgi:hypothetical protein